MTGDPYSPVFWILDGVSLLTAYSSAMVCSNLPLFLVSSWATGIPPVLRLPWSLSGWDGREPYGGRRIEIELAASASPNGSS